MKKAAYVVFRLRIGSLYDCHYRTVEETEMNITRTGARSHNQIRTEVVTTYQQLLHAYAIPYCFMENTVFRAA